MKPLSSLFTCLLGIYFCVAIVNTQIELPRQPVGFKYVPTPAASPSSKFLTVKVFLDILCPDSYRAFRLLLNIMPRYCDQGVRLTVVLFPLPFHQHSYVLTKAAHAIHCLNSSLTYHWISAVYENMDKFSMSNTMNSTGEKVLSEIVKLATQVGLDSDQFLTMYNTRKVELETRTSFKYGCLRGVASTPTYFINDIPIVMDGNFPEGNITSLISNLAPQKSESVND